MFFGHRGQWRDEFEKYAPQLNVVIYHSGSGNSKRDQIVLGKLDLSDVDVILSTPGSGLPPWLCEVGTIRRDPCSCDATSCASPARVHATASPQTFGVWRQVASIHRTIVDEAHESLGNAHRCPSGLRWAVTGEPTARSVARL